MLPASTPWSVKKRTFLQHEFSTREKTELVSWNYQAAANCRANTSAKGKWLFNLTTVISGIFQLEIHCTPRYFEIDMPFELNQSTKYGSLTCGRNFSKLSTMNDIVAVTDKQNCMRAKLMLM